MAQFILVHGSWHGAWCWSEVVPLLEVKGHAVNALDLPGHGKHPSSPESVTLNDYVNCVVEAVETSRQAPIIVGHSMAGFISLVAELVPTLIRSVVFVSAIVPANGRSMMQYVSRFDPEYLDQIQWSPDRRTVMIRTEGVRNFLYQLCPPAAVAAASNLLTPEPVAPFESPFLLRETTFGRAPRYYIQCLRDRVVPISIQREVCASGFKHLYSLDTDHSPFFSTPSELVAILDSIAKHI